MILSKIAEMPPSVLLIFAVNIILVSWFILFRIFVFPKREWTEETKRRPRSFVSNAAFREWWYVVIGPFKKKLVDWNVNPNTITTWGFCLSILAGAAFSIGEFGIGGWLVILGATCDIYDGQLARLREIKLKSGAFYDSVLDRVGEVAIFYGIAKYFRADDTLFLIIFLGFAASQVVSYSRARAEGLGYGHLGARGFFQRAERMICLSIGMPFAPMFEHFWGLGDWLVKFTVVFICIGSIQTALSRMTGTFIGIKKDEKEKGLINK
ncbi:CDP-alcohol phosphatidyltransferase family protein [bacterium]|nr:CDP-alcohol phosphatidyltransferase family protein [bacterium]